MNTDSSPMATPEAQPSLDARSVAELLGEALTPSVLAHLSSSIKSKRPRNSPTTSRRTITKHPEVTLFERLLEAEEREAANLRQTLHDTNQRLQWETARAEAAENRMKETAAKANQLLIARKDAEAEAARVREELKLYKLQLENSQREVIRAQKELNALNDDRDEAEAAAARARTTARKLQEKVLLEEAKKSGFMAGLNQGLEQGRRTGWEEGQEEGIAEERARANKAFVELLQDGGLEPEEEKNLRSSVSALFPERTRNTSMPSAPRPPSLPQTGNPSNHQRSKTMSSIENVPSSGHGYDTSVSSDSNNNVTSSAGARSRNGGTSLGRNRLGLTRRNRATSNPDPLSNQSRPPDYGKMAPTLPRPTLTTPDPGVDIRQASPSPLPSVRSGRTGRSTSPRPPVNTIPEGYIPTLEEDGLSLPPPHTLNTTPGVTPKPLPHTQSQSQSTTYDSMPSTAESQQSMPIPAPTGRAHHPRSRDFGYNRERPPSATYQEPPTQPSTATGTPLTSYSILSSLEPEALLRDRRERADAANRAAQREERRARGEVLSPSPPPQSPVDRDLRNVRSMLSTIMEHQSPIPNRDDRRYPKESDTEDDFYVPPHQPPISMPNPHSAYQQNNQRGPSRQSNHQSRADDRHREEPRYSDSDDVDRRLNGNYDSNDIRSAQSQPTHHPLSNIRQMTQNIPRFPSPPNSGFHHSQPPTQPPPHSFGGGGNSYSMPVPQIVLSPDRDETDYPPNPPPKSRTPIPPRASQFSNLKDAIARSQGSPSSSLGPNGFVRTHGRNSSVPEITIEPPSRPQSNNSAMTRGTTKHLLSPDDATQRLPDLTTGNQGPPNFGQPSSQYYSQPPGNGGNGPIVPNSDLSYVSAFRTQTPVRTPAPINTNVPPFTTLRSATATPHSRSQSAQFPPTQTQQAQIHMPTYRNPPDPASPKPPNEPQRVPLPPPGTTPYVIPNTPKPLSFGGPSFPEPNPTSSVHGIQFPQPSLGVPEPSGPWSGAPPPSPSSLARPKSPFHSVPNPSSNLINSPVRTVPLEDIVIPRTPSPRHPSTTPRSRPMKITDRSKPRNRHVEDDPDIPATAPYNPLGEANRDHRASGAFGVEPDRSYFTGNKSQPQSLPVDPVIPMDTEFGAWESTHTPKTRPMSTFPNHSRTPTDPGPRGILANSAPPPESIVIPMESDYTAWDIPPRTPKSRPVSTFSTSRNRPAHENTPKGILVNSVPPADFDYQPSADVEANTNANRNLTTPRSMLKPIDTQLRRSGSQISLNSWSHSQAAREPYNDPAFAASPYSTFKPELVPELGRSASRGPSRTPSRAALYASPYGVMRPEIEAELGPSASRGPSRAPSRAASVRSRVEVEIVSDHSEPREEPMRMPEPEPEPAFAPAGKNKKGVKKKGKK